MGRLVLLHSSPSPFTTTGWAASVRGRVVRQTCMQEPTLPGSGAVTRSYRLVSVASPSLPTVGGAPRRATSTYPSRREPHPSSFARRSHPRRLRMWSIEVNAAPFVGHEGPRWLTAVTSNGRLNRADTGRRRRSYRSGQGG